MPSAYEWTPFDENGLSVGLHRGQPFALIARASGIKAGGDNRYRVNVMGSDLEQRYRFLVVARNAAKAAFAQDYLPVSPTITPASTNPKAKPTRSR